METMFWIWMSAALVFLIVEVGVPGLVFVCFAIGSIGAAIFAQFEPNDYVIQTGIFAVITIVLVPFSRKIAKKISLSSAPESNVDALMGQSAIVVKDIRLLEGEGQVRVQGEIWSATASEDIELGGKVTVVGIEGNTLTVRRGIDVTPAENNS